MLEEAANAAKALKDREDAAAREVTARMAAEAKIAQEREIVQEREAAAYTRLPRCFPGKFVSDRGQIRRGPGRNRPSS